MKPQESGERARQWRAQRSNHKEVISAIIVVLIVLSQCVKAYVNHEAIQLSIEKLPNCFL